MASGDEEEVKALPPEDGEVKLPPDAPPPPSTLETLESTMKLLCERITELENRPAQLLPRTPRRVGRDPGPKSYKGEWCSGISKEILAASGLDTSDYKPGTSVRGEMLVGYSFLCCTLFVCRYAMGWQ